MKSHSTSLPRSACFPTSIQAIAAASERISRYDDDIAKLVQGWRLWPLVTAPEALRGVGLVEAASSIDELGDLKRFATPRKLMAYVGAGPSEHTVGKREREVGVCQEYPTAPRRKYILRQKTRRPSATRPYSTATRILTLGRSDVRWRNPSVHLPRGTAPHLSDQPHSCLLSKLQGTGLFQVGLIPTGPTSACWTQRFSRTRPV